MTIERARYDGPIIFCCDECGEVDETHCSDFTSALAKVKSHGWVAVRKGEDWLHHCRGCRRWSS